MESEHTLYKIYTPSTNSVQICRRRDFTVLLPDTALPSIETLMSDIVKEQAIDEEQQLDEDEIAEKALENVCLHITANNLYM